MHWRSSGVAGTLRRPPAATSLKRTLTLPLLVLYGLGVTIGAGIYVLIGAAALRGGSAAPLAFVLAAIVMGVTGATFAEFAGRVPLSAGEAAYVRAGFDSRTLSLVVGALVFGVAAISAAAIAKGAAGYLATLVSWPITSLILSVIAVAATVAAFGIREALSIAAAMTLVEVGGLLAIIVGGFMQDSDAVVATAVAATQIPTSMAVLHGVLGAFLLAFFALIGFESIVNLAEEAHTPARLLPWAIGLTLVLATVLYVAVMIVALALVSPVELGQSTAPLGLVFGRATGLAPTGVAVIAVAATFNGIIAQIILAARVLYGLAQQGALPHWLGHVSPVTRTPLAATALSAALVVSVSLGAPVDALADMTARLMLLVFLAVNAALLALKWNGDPAPAGTLVVPMAVPLAGCLLCAALLLLGVLI